MFKKYFYIIRHGETILNAERRRQGSDGKLSPRGVTQVTEAAQRLQKTKITKMFVSPFERTIETSQIINSFLNLKDKKIIYIDLLVERKNPTNIIGKSYDDKIVKEFIDTMDKSFHDENLRMYDEENFKDLKERAIKARDYLIKESDTYNLCVTHAIFLKMFLSVLVYGDNLTVENYVEASEFNPADNAAMTLVSFDTMTNFLNKILFRDVNKNPEYNPWEILSYNDYNR